MRYINNHFRFHHQTKQRFAAKLFALFALLMAVSACSIPEEDGVCKSEYREKGAYLFETKVYVPADEGPVDAGGDDPTVGWTSANVKVIEGEPINLRVSNSVNLCSGNITTSFGRSQPVDVKIEASDVDVTTRGWKDTGIRLYDDSSPVRYTITDGSYTMYSALLLAKQIKNVDFRIKKGNLTSRYKLEKEILKWGELWHAKYRATKGVGLFVFIGPSAPSDDWFGQEEQGSFTSRDDFFELYGDGYYGLPPRVADPSKPNKIYVRYAIDPLNRDNFWYDYECGLIECEWTSLGSQPWGLASNSDGELEDTEGGYNFEIEHGCTGAYGRYLDAMVVDRDDTVYKLGGNFDMDEPDTTFEGELLSNKGVYKGTIPANGRLYFRVVDKNDYGDGDGNYQNNDNKYTVKIKTTIQPDNVGVLSNFLYNYIIKPVRLIFLGDPSKQEDGAASDMFKQLLGKDASNTGTVLVTIIRAMLVLYIAIYGLMFILSLIKDSRKDFFIRLLKIAIILQLTHAGSWEFFNKYLFNAFINGTDDVALIFTQQFEGIDGNMDYVIDTNLPETINVPDLGAIDGGGAPLTSGSDPFAFTNITFNLLGTSFFWEKVGALLYGGYLGWLFIALIIVGMFWFFSAILYAVYVYLMSIVIVALLLAVAPIFISLALFEQTHESFRNWLFQLANYTLQPALLLAALTIFNVFVYSMFHRIASMTICLACQVEVNFFGLFQFCLLRAYEPWADLSGGSGWVDEAGIGDVAISVTTVLVFFIMLHSIRTIGHHTTGIVSFIFGGNPSGGLLSKEMGFQDPEATTKKAAKKALAPATGALKSGGHLTRAGLQSITPAFLSSKGNAANSLNKAKAPWKKGYENTRQSLSKTGKVIRFAAAIGTLGISEVAYGAAKGAGGAAKSVNRKRKTGSFFKSAEEKREEAAKKAEKGQTDSVGYTKRLGNFLGKTLGGE